MHIIPMKESYVAHNQKIAHNRKTLYPVILVNKQIKPLNNVSSFQYSSISFFFFVMMLYFCQKCCKYFDESFTFVDWVISFQR